MLGKQSSLFLHLAEAEVTPISWCKLSTSQQGEKGEENCTPAKGKEGMCQNLVKEG